MKFTNELDRLEAVAEYAQNVVAIWDQPRRDTAVGEATHAMQMVKGIDLLREALRSGSEEGAHD